MKMDISLERIEKVWEEALELEKDKDGLLRHAKNNSDVLYLWVVKMAKDELESCYVKIIEDLDDPFRDHSDDLFVEYQPIEVPLTQDEIFNLDTDPLFPCKYESLGTA